MDIFLPPSKRSDQLRMFWCNYVDTHTHRYTCIDSSSEMTSHTPESCINARDSIYNLVILGNNKDWEWWSFLKEGTTPSKLTSREALSVKKTKQALDRMPHSTQDEKRAPACKHPSGGRYQDPIPLIKRMKTSSRSPGLCMPAHSSVLRVVGPVATEKCPQPT